MTDYSNAFVKVVFDIDANCFFQLVEDGHFLPQLVEDTGFFEDVAFPLHHITICWDILYSKYEEWKSERERKALFKKKCENDKIKDFFVRQCGLNMTNIDFTPYNERYLYCEDYDEDVEDMLNESKESLVNRGFREKDIDLFFYASKLNFEETGRLLRGGANPKAQLLWDTLYDDIYEKICSRYAVTAPDLMYVIHGKKYAYQNLEERVTDLLQLASLEKMITLLKAYTTKS